MIKNYIVIAWRNLIRNKVFSAINILGLAAGLAICLLIALFIIDEYSYDRFHEDYKDIYRLVGVHQEGGINVSMPHPLAAMFNESAPAVASYTRFLKRNNLLIQRAGYPDFLEYEDGLLYADSDVFRVFSYEFLRGNPDQALVRPFTVVLTESMARRYFGTDDPMGETLLVDDEFEFEVTGVIENPPIQSVIQFQFLASFSTLSEHAGESGMYGSGWGAFAYPTFIRLAEGVSTETAERQIQTIAVNHAPQWVTESHTFSIEPLTDIYLFSNGVNGLGPKSDFRYISIFFSISLVILLVACINYLNLSTARILKRSREVGVRKTCGASRSQLAFQFLGEAFLITFFAVLLALVLVELALPAFNTILDKEVGTLFKGIPYWWIVIPCFVLVTGLLSGIFPAFVLSGQKVTRALRGSGAESAELFPVRKVLVVSQFAASIALIISTIVIQQQLGFIQDRNLGLNKENVVVIPFRTSPVAEQADAFKQALLQHSQVLSVSLAASHPPGDLGRYFIQMDNAPEGRLSYGVYHVDGDFISTLGIRMVEGMEFPAFTEEGSFALVNETMIRNLGWEDPIGRKIPMTFGDMEFTIRGVFEDFHFESLHNEIEPLALFSFLPWSPKQNAIVRVQDGSVVTAIEVMKATWEQFAPGHPYLYFFLDEKYQSLYENEIRTAAIFNTFTLLIILIACLGLFGLSVFMAETRTKEIGIRKVMGATVANIIALLNKDFVKLVIIGFILAIPIAWYAMNRWLEGFAYRIEIGAGVFILAGASAILIALATVSWQSVRAAIMNPVNSLRSE